MRFSVSAAPVSPSGDPATLPAPALAHVPRWLQGRRAADGWPCSAGAASGISAVADLLGLAPVVPLARYDRMGLVRLLKSARVVSLTSTTAAISSGHSYSRRKD